MTDKEKVKAYDKAIERANKVLLDCTKEERNVVEYLHPELIVSEDEKIRKAMIKGLSSCGSKYWGGFEVKAAIDYLEKQGKQKPAEYTLEQAVGIFLDALSNTPYNNKPITDAQVITKELLKFLSDSGLYNPNAINEQNPTEKFEPKFKAGDWILHCGTEKVYHVVGIKDNKYQIKCNGNYTEEKIADVERCARKWDITKDAKDGDVLVSPLLGDDKGGVQIFMFKCLENRAYADNCVEFYNRLCLGVFYNNEEHYFMGTTKSPVYPATKEQRELLFQKMHDAGYEWDAERKQLKKLINK